MDRKIGEYLIIYENDDDKTKTVKVDSYEINDEFIIFIENKERIYLPKNKLHKIKEVIA